MKVIFEDRSGKGWDDDRVMGLVVNKRLIIQVKNEYSQTAYELDAEKAKELMKAISLIIHELN